MKYEWIVLGGVRFGLNPGLSNDQRYQVWMRFDRSLGVRLVSKA